MQPGLLSGRRFQYVLFHLLDSLSPKSPPPISTCLKGDRPSRLPGLPAASLPAAPSRGTAAPCAHSAARVRVTSCPPRARRRRVPGEPSQRGMGQFSWSQNWVTRAPPAPTLAVILSETLSARTVETQIHSVLTPETS